jgi:hypothetical protein
MRDSGTWSRLEITKLKAVIGNSNIVKQADVNDWIKPKYSKAEGHRFSAHDPPQLQLRNRFIVLEMDKLEAVQQSPGFLNQEDRGVNTSVGKLERQKTKIVLLGSSHRRGMELVSQENLGSKPEVYGILKSSAPLAAVEVVRKFGKDLTKQDHIVIVGGARSSLNRNQYYSINISVSLQRGQVTQMWDMSTFSGDMTNCG